VRIYAVPTCVGVFVEQSMESFVQPHWWLQVSTGE